MKLALFLPNVYRLQPVSQAWEPDLTPADLMRIASTADRLGFSSLMLPEHFVIPADRVQFSGARWLDLPTTHGFLAACTENIRINSMISILALRHPILTAKAVSTLDYLSNGRAGLTCAVGWMESEFEHLGVPFKDRGKRCDDYLQAMFALWSSEISTYNGEYVSFNEVACEPLPVQKPHPPIWMGGDAEAVLHRAARFGDGWAPWKTPPEKFPEQLDKIKSHPEWVDRPFDVFVNPTGLAMGDGHEPGTHPLTETLMEGLNNSEKLVEMFKFLSDHGATESVLYPQTAGLEQYLEYLQWLSEEVMPHIAQF